MNNPDNAVSRRTWLISLSVTIGLIILIELLKKTPYSVPNPAVIVLLAVVYAAFAGGLRVGLTCAALSLVYHLHFFSLPGQPFQYTPENLRRVIVLAITTPAFALLVGMLKRRADRTREFKRSNEILKAQIEERKKSEGRLQDSVNYNRMLFEESVIGLALCRMDGSLVDVNPTYAAILGRTVEETLRLTYWDITPEDYAPQEQAQLESLKATGRYGPYEKEYIHKDGHRVPVRLQGQLIEQRGERFIWSSVEDIANRKMAEEEIRTINEELAAINRIITASAGALSINDILEKVMDEALRITGLEGGTTCLVTPENTLELAAHRATSEATILDLTSNQIKIGDCLCGECARDEDRSHLFQPFTQLEGVLNKTYAGVGLGLALAKRLVASLDGRIRVESEFGKGSVFTFTLPAEAGMTKVGSKNDKGVRE
ncbi:MAG: PAS domain S-box protein [Smithellaceae bacterium]|nr:PAS domain S-box protein [Smithellaceae bacterium]